MPLETKLRTWPGGFAATLLLCVGIKPVPAKNNSDDDETPIQRTGTDDTGVTETICRVLDRCRVFGGTARRSRFLFR